MANLKFDKVYKDQLFYNRYKYCMRFRLPEVSVLRVLDHERIDSIIDFRIESRREAATRYSSYAKKHGIGAVIPVIQMKRWRDITDEMRTDLHTVADFFISTRIDYKLVISVDLAWVYTNNSNLIQDLKRFPIYAKKYSKAVVNRPKNSILLKEPHHTHRSFFRTVRLEKLEREALVAFLNNHTDEIRMSPALKEWVADGFSRTQDYFFVDHDGPQWLTMFGLVRPGLIKKTYDIILAK